ncbi:MAG TPA: GAF domain-containing protein, partial [Bacteroidales bacterium]|nr:GAF domain-containing protein [Bacteroidales bacterium]
MLDRRKIWAYSTFFATSLLLGIIATFVTSAYILYTKSIPLSYPNIISIYQQNNIYSFIKLIPFLSSILGLIMAYLYIKDREKHWQNETRFDNTIDTIINFTNRISKGELNYAASSLLLQNKLKNSLEGMRQYLLTLNRAEKDRMNISNSIAEINKLVRPINELQDLTDQVTKFVVKKIDIVVQGALYVTDEEDVSNNTLILNSLYAYDRSKHIYEKHQYNDGIIGQAALEKDIIHLTEIPEEYVTVTSGLIGHRKPTSIIILPLLVNDEVNGILELAAVNKFNDLQIRMIEEMGEIIARTVQNVRANEKTRNLLAESEKMSTELASQKKQLEQNAKEMIATQEQLKESNDSLEQQIQQVHQANQKTQIILENSLEIIFIYDTNGNTSYVSPSILPVLGYYSDEILGKKSTENIHPLDTSKYEKFLSDIKSYPEK